MPHLHACVSQYTEGLFKHETESPWPLHFEHSHWWERRSRSKFASHCAWRTNGVCECKMYVKSTWIATQHWMDGSHFMVTWIIFKNHLLEVAHDDYTSSTLIGRKGGAGPSSLHTALEGPNGVRECKMDVKSTWIATWHRMDKSCFLVTWIIFKNHPLEVARDHYTSSTLIGGKGGAGPSSLHIALEGPTENVHARWL